MITEPGRTPLHLVVRRPVDSIWLEQACRAAGRNLTVEEWATYIGGTPRATCPQWSAPA